MKLGYENRWPLGLGTRVDTSSRDGLAVRAVEDQVVCTRIDKTDAVPCGEIKLTMTQTEDLIDALQTALTEAVARSGKGAARVELQRWIHRRLRL